MRYFVDEEGGVEMARDGVRGKKSTDLVVYVINEATKLLKGTSVQRNYIRQWLESRRYGFSPSRG